jgi:hypothetical protein
MANINYREAVLIDSSPEPEAPAANSSLVGQQPHSKERVSPTEVRPNEVNQSVSSMPQLFPFPAQQKPQPRVEEGISLMEVRPNEVTQIVSFRPQPFLLTAQEQQPRQLQRAVPLGSGSLPIGGGNHSGKLVPFSSNVDRWHPTEGFQPIELPPASMLNLSTPGITGPTAVGDERAPTKNYSARNTDGWNDNEGRNETRSGKHHSPIVLY